MWEVSALARVTQRERAPVEIGLGDLHFVADERLRHVGDRLGGGGVHFQILEDGLGVVHPLVRHLARVDDADDREGHERGGEESARHQNDLDEGGNPPPLVARGFCVRTRSSCESPVRTVEGIVNNVPDYEQAAAMFRPGRPNPHNREQPCRGSPRYLARRPPGC